MEQKHHLDLWQSLTKGKGMNKNKYQVWFSTCNYKPERVYVYASCVDNAIILAKAKRIKEDLDCTISSIKQVENNRPRA